MFNKHPERHAEGIKAPESFRVGEVMFVGEQDGQVEREFKARLVERFKTDIHVTEAFLVRVRYASSVTQNVALCVRTENEDPSRVVEVAGSEFRQMFSTTTSLDILFLSAERLREVSLVAKPFYKQPVVDSRES